LAHLRRDHAHVDAPVPRGHESTPLPTRRCAHRFVQQASAHDGPAPGSPANNSGTAIAFTDQRAKPARGVTSPTIPAADGSSGGRLGRRDNSVRHQRLRRSSTTSDQSIIIRDCGDSRRDADLFKKEDRSRRSTSRRHRGTRRLKSSAIASSHRGTTSPMSRMRNGQVKSAADGSRSSLGRDRSSPAAPRASRVRSTGVHETGPFRYCLRSRRRVHETARVVNQARCSPAPSPRGTGQCRKAPAAQHCRGAFRSIGTCSSRSRKPAASSRFRQTQITGR